MAEDGERRAFGRGLVNMAVVVTTDDGRTVAGGCRDLSLDGVFVCTRDRPDLGTPCRIAMTHSDGRRAVAIEAAAVVARHTPGGFGVQFTAVGAEDLRRIYHLLTEYAVVLPDR